MHISFKVTAKCQGSCSDCSVRYWMKANKDYVMSIEDVDKFIYYSKLSKYSYSSIVLSGGEPLLWPHIVEATGMLKRAKLTKRINMYTNSLKATEDNLDFLSNIIRNISFVRVSKYHGNEKNVDLLVKHFGKHIKVVNYTNRPQPPWKRIPDTLPAECGCQGYEYVQGVMDICGPARTLIIGLGWKLEDYPWISETLKKNFMDRLLTIDRYNMKFCEYCIGNRKIWPKITHAKCNV